MRQGYRQNGRCHTLGSNMYSGFICRGAMQGCTTCGSAGRGKEGGGGRGRALHPGRLDEQQHPAQGGQQGGCGLVAGCTSVDSTAAAISALNFKF